MNFTRRNFFRSATALATMSLTQLQSLSATAQMHSGGAPKNEKDDDYWRGIRQLFPLTHSMTYLNNGTFGPSPYPVIEAVKEGMMESDRNGQYGNWEDTVEKIAKLNNRMHS